MILASASLSSYLRFLSFVLLGNLYEAISEKDELTFFPSLYF
jgi:hypothetical protein